MELVTEYLLDDLKYGPGEYVKRALRAAPAKSPLPATLRAELDWLSDSATDRTMGFISKVLAYSKIFDKPKRHTNILRLIKGGFVDVYRINEQPPQDSRAKRESPYSDSYYLLEAH